LLARRNVEVHFFPQCFFERHFEIFFSAELRRLAAAARTRDPGEKGPRNYERHLLAWMELVNLFAAKVNLKAIQRLSGLRGRLKSIIILHK
jgi:hypothetical protein